jgi:ABC-type multidrug transport system fused ATPase/permease subunit
MRQTIIVMSIHVEFDLKNEVFRHYEVLDQNFYKNNRTGDLMNRISEDVAKIRFFQTFSSILGLWIGLSNNFELYSIAISTFISVFVGIFLIAFKYKNFFLDLYNFKVHLIETIWKNEMWPFQWKIAISWISGYFIYQSFVPILFSIHGPAQAGQMGMTLQIVLTIGSTALVWITTKAPFFGKLIAEKDFKKLDKIFFNALIKSYFFMIFSSFSLVGVLYYLGKYYPHYSNRLIPLDYFIILLLGAAFNHFINSSAFYLRAYKEERFMYLSVSMSLFISGLAFMLIPLWGQFGAVVSYSVGIIFIGFPWALTIFFKNKRRTI